MIGIEMKLYDPFSWWILFWWWVSVMGFGFTCFLLDISNGSFLWNALWCLGFDFCAKPSCNVHCDECIINIVSVLFGFDF